MAKPPHTGGEMGVLYLMCWRRNYPQATGTRPIVSGREGFDSSPFDWSVSDSFELSTCLPIRARMSSKGSESGAASLITEAVVLRWVGVIEAPFEEKGLTFPLCCFGQISCWLQRSTP